MNNVHLPTLGAWGRFLLALAAYLTALLAAWLVTVRGFPSPMDAAVLVVLFPVGLAAFGKLIAWLPVPDVAGVLMHALYPVFLLALTLAGHVRTFWRLYAVFVGVLVLNVTGCAMISRSW